MRDVNASYPPPRSGRGVTAQTPGFTGCVIPTIPTIPFLKSVEIYKSNTPARPWHVRAVEVRNLA
jgi:hypothetical protein